MKNFGLNRSLVVVAALTFALCAYESVEAYGGGSWGSRGSAGSTGSWGSSGGYASSGGFASSGGYGSSGGYHRPFRPVRNFFASVHQAHQRRWGGSSGGFASSGGSYMGSSGGSSGGFVYSSMGSMGSSGGTSAVYLGSPVAPVMAQPSMPVEHAVESGQVPNALPTPSTLEKPATDATEAAPTPSPASDSDTRFIPSKSRDAILNLDLPSQATVWINGRKTTTPGSWRRYVSRNLVPGKEYEFEIKAVIDKDGDEVAMHRKVVLRAGSTESIKLDFDQPQLTQLSVKVPSDAVVTLSGNPTSAQGEVRYFKSRTLKPGESWSDYRVKVTVVRDGKTYVAEKRLDVESGGEYALAFDFNQPDLYVAK